MSISAYAYAIIGCRISAHKIRYKRIVQHMEHTFPKGAKYCPVCGDETSTEEEQDIPEFDENNEKLCGMDVYFHYDINSELQYVFVGEIISTDDGMDQDEAIADKFDITELFITTLKDKLKTKLSKANLWNEMDFGLWVICDVS